MSDFNLYNLRSGYSGTDNMRQKAQKLLGGEMRSTDMSPRASASAPSRTPMRAYKKGGHVAEERRHEHNEHAKPRAHHAKHAAHHERHHEERGERYPSSDQIQGAHLSAMHFPHRMKMERSGHEVREHHGVGPDHERRMAQGGFGLARSQASTALRTPMKKGGCGLPDSERYSVRRGESLPGSERESSAMRKGGRAPHEHHAGCRHHSHGKNHRYAEGGHVEEGPIGEFNYGGEYHRGAEGPTRHSRGGAIPMSNGGSFDEGGSLPYARGGSIPMRHGGRRHYDEGGEVEENPFSNMTLGMPEEDHQEPMYGTEYGNHSMEPDMGMEYGSHSMEPAADPYANMGVGQIRAKMGMEAPEHADGLKRGGRPRAHRMHTPRHNEMRHPHHEHHGHTRMHNESGLSQALNMERAPFEHGKVGKYAMGGVGKMRHNEATSKGRPISKRGPRTLSETY